MCVCVRLFYTSNIPTSATIKRHCKKHAKHIIAFEPPSEQKEKYMLLGHFLSQVLGKEGAAEKLVNGGEKRLLLCF